MVHGVPLEPEAKRPRSQDQARSHARPANRREWRVLAGLIVLVGRMCAGLFLAARSAASNRSNSPQALAIPEVSIDEGCTNFARYWIEESGIEIEPSTIEGLTNCRLSSDGEWFVPTGPNDRRLPESERMTDDERARSAPTRQALLDQIRDLESQLSKSIKS